MNIRFRQRWMAEIGHGQTHYCPEADFRYRSFADLGASDGKVRFTPVSRHRVRRFPVR